MVEPPMPPGPVEPGGEEAERPDDDVGRREEAAVEPGEPLPDREDPKTR
jgi:hypothetical protein